VKSNFNVFSIILLSGILGLLSISSFSFPKERVEHNILFIILLSISVYTIRKNKLGISKTIFLIPRTVIYGLLLLFIVILYTTLLNFKGEYFTKKMYIERSKGNNKTVIDLSKHALSFFYSIDPTSIPINWYKGNANANLGNYLKARSDFKSALKANPYNYHVLNDLGSSYFMQNNMDSAIYFYKEAVRINPRFDDPKLNLAVIYINKGIYKEAKKWNESILHDSDRRNNYRNIINQNMRE